MTRKLRTSLLTVLCILLPALAFALSGSVFADTTEEMVTATINYYYYDETTADHKGSQPFPPFVAHMPKNSAAMAERSPVVPGFSPCDINKNSLESVEVSFTGDSVTDVFYFPSEVPYIIRLNQQKADLSGYELSVIINGSGITGTEPEEFGSDAQIDELGGRTLENAFDGFTLMYHVPEVIAADGSTEFECFYDRNYYLVNFDLGSGGYGVDPIYAPYESPLSVKTPIRAGYDFAGWSPELQPNVTGDMTYTALWEKKAQVPYTIVYKNADISDGSGNTSYDFWGTRTFYADPDTQIDIDELIAEYSSYPELDDYEYFTFDEETTKANNPADITVRGDGSTLIKFYYSRNKYKLRFVYLKYSSDVDIVPKRATEITEGKYYIINRRKNKAVTPEISSRDARYLAMEALSENQDIIWTVESDGNGGYYIKSADGKYLTMTNTNAYVSDTPVSSVIDNWNNNSEVWNIMQPYNNTNWYLNNKGNSDYYVGPSGNIPNDAGSAYYFSPTDDSGTVNYETKVKNIKAASGTGNGNFPTSANMNYILPYLPDVDTSSGLTTGTYLYNGELYAYVELVAEYNADIEDLWPAAIIGDSGDYSFGSWSTQAGTKYRERNSTHANIVGPYPYMSAEMIVDASDVYDPDDSESIAQLLWAWWGKPSDNVGDHRFNIYYEALDGSGFELDRTIELVAAHNSNTRIDPFVYKGFTIIPEDAGGHSVSHGVNNGHHLEYDDEHPDGIWTTDFHYTRNRSSLIYYNYNGNYSNGTDTSSIMYGQPLEGFDPGEPPYPEELQPGAYEFAGWYDSDTYDELFDWNSTMPDHDLIVYAYWKPKTFTINFYNDESDYLDGNPYKHTETDDYGTLIDTTEAEEKLTAPVITNSTGNYDAAKAGWYYYDSDNNLHAFDPATMTVSGDMDLFMKWSSTVPTAFEVHYLVKNSENEKVAADTTGYSFVGLTRTFKAKVDDELSEGYQTHYFPDRASTSILMNSDNSRNVKAFYYTYRDRVPYTVRYLDKNTKEVLHEEKVVSDNIYSVVSEKYVPVENYVPESYYITLTLTVSDDPGEEALNNVITFYYIEDTINMPYHVKYMTEDDNGRIEKEIDGVTYRFSEVNYIDSVGQRGTDKTVPLNHYNGYVVNSYNEVVYETEDDTEVKRELSLQDISGGTSSISLHLDEDCNSKEVHIYYLKKTYPVKVIYETTDMDDKTTAEWNAVMLAAESGLTGEDPFEYEGETFYRSFYKIPEEQKYNSTYSEEAPEAEGFRLTGGRTKNIVIADDDDSFTRNRIKFMYTKIEEIMFSYFAVIPDGSGKAAASPEELLLLSYNQQIVRSGARPDRAVKAEAEDQLYRFVGWYSDEACTERVTDQAGFNILSGELKNELRPLGSNVDKSYYALYDYKRGALEVSTSGCGDASQSFEYIIKGKDQHNSWIELKICIQGDDSRIISGLPIGNYEVTQTGWSWRYTPDEQTLSAVVPDGNITHADFEQSMSNKKWLDGNGYKDNVFSD